MSLLLCALLAAGPAAAREHIILTSRDRQILAERNMLRAYEAIWSLKPEIDQLSKELEEVQAGYSGKMEGEPGGPRRLRVRNRLAGLLNEFYLGRRRFRERGVQQRIGSAVTMVMEMKQGHTGLVGNEVSIMGLQNSLIDDARDFQDEHMALLTAEQKAYAEALRRYQNYRADMLRQRRLAEAAAAAALTLLLLVWILRREPPAPAPAALGAARAGRYTLLHEGRPWSFGARFDAVQDGTRRLVSLGLLDPRLYPSPPEAARFVEKLRAVGAFKHDALPAFVEAFLWEGRVYLATAPVIGKPIASWLEQGKPAALGPALLALRSVADLLDRAHSVSLVHGALTPDRIVLGEAGQVLVEDLGLGPLCAALVHPDPGYAAPEQESGRALPQSDLYAFGVILHETLTGKRAALDVPPTRLDPSLPAPLDALVAGLLIRDPRRRSPRPGALQRALESLAS